MTQFQRKTHRARRILDAVSHAYPQAWATFDRFRRDRGRSPDFDWPDWCYMPIAGGYAVVSGGGRGRVPISKAHHPAIVTALGTWRMTQGIYRFDPALRAALLDTPIEGDIPTEHLRHLPEWCVYVELDDEWAGRPLYGAWLHMEHDANTAASELRAVLDCARDPRQPLAEDGLVPLALPLVGGSLDESLRALDDSARRQASALGMDLPTDAVPAAHDTIWPRLLSMALYLCADADITRRGIEDRPSNPTPRRTKNGWELHPASGPREWDVGVRIGAALRSYPPRDHAGQDRQSETGRRVRPHIRRAHWHTIVSGPLKGPDGSVIPATARTRELRWMHPIAVGVEDRDALPAVVRKVQPQGVIPT